MVRVKALNLMVRSVAQQHVSNHGRERQRCPSPSFETAASQPPQDEELMVRVKALNLMVRSVA